MKIAICNPPLSGPGIPLLSQNRQFQWYRSPITSYTIYPVIPAYAATMLKKAGFKVFWLDGVAQRWTYQRWEEQIKKIKPDLIMIETKTPVVKQHWRIIDSVKCQVPTIKCVLVGDHVTALPYESFKESRVDYILAGGDYDFLLLNLVKYLSGQKKELGNGVYFRNKKGKVVKTEGERRGHNLESLPLIDRKLTKWRFYSSGSGNFKYKPNTYTMIGRDCWWRRPSNNGKSGCTFCSWTSIFPSWRVGKAEQLLEEIDYLIKLGVKEVFDDTGTFPIGKWLHEFCQGMIERGYNQKIVFGCNMRAGALAKEDFQLMKKAGFRFILYGLESFNRKTLDRLNKGTTSEVLEQSLKLAKEAGLSPHVTVMFGYPWETKGEAHKTIDFVHNLFNLGYIDTLQATLLIPYPGTALFEEAKIMGWLLTEDWKKYDMSGPILKTPMSEAELKEIVRKCYHAFWSRRFVFRKLSGIRSFHDFSLYFFQAAKYISKLIDFLPMKQNETPRV